MMEINTAKKIFYLVMFIFFTLFIANCAPRVPMSEYPAEREMIFHASFDKTWDAVLKLVVMSNGTIITEDKSSGLIVYMVPPEKWMKCKIGERDLGTLFMKVFMNVYLKNPSSASITSVYLVPRAYNWMLGKSGVMVRGVIADCFVFGEKGVERDFFEKLEKNLGRI